MGTFTALYLVHRQSSTNPCPPEHRNQPTKSVGEEEEQIKHERCYHFTCYPTYGIGIPVCGLLSNLILSTKGMGSLVVFYIAYEITYFCFNSA